MLNKGTKFFATWTPQYINGEENLHGQSISRKGLWDEKSKIDVNKKLKLFMYLGYITIYHSKVKDTKLNFKNIKCFRIDCRED